MELMLDRIHSGIWQVVSHVVSILPVGTLFGAAVALGLPRHPHVDVVIFLLLAVSGSTSILVHASAFKQARLGPVAMIIALGYIISRTRCFTEYPKSVDELVTGLRDYALIMAVVISVVAMMMPGTVRTRQLSGGIAEEEDHLPSLSAEPRSALRKPMAKRSWDLSSTTSHLDLLSHVGSLDFKFMPGPNSHYSDHSSSKDSVITLSSGSERDLGRIMDIIQWATATAPTTPGTKGDTISTQTSVPQGSA
ncbi:hypothetical protein BKA59DRAFT_106791 [Fusarium tricinctum]|uniref:Transmembrane protein n=1 Tax=Fusarium tricinctum TaxID=61284 RepID=A0A8K0S511_9HYPO|nr:hypothetical protein BKA59DRAFT_106791 [Fusarium tricinctum]